MKATLFPAVLALLLAMPLSLKADDSLEREVQLILRSFKYLKGIDSHNNTIHLGVIYNSAVEQSVQEARLFLELIQQSREANRIGFRAELVDISELDRAIHLGLAYVTNGLDEHYDKVYLHAKTHRVFTISTNEGCVRRQCCILSFDASSGVNVFLNQANLRSLGFGINGAFKFMVKRV